MPLVLTFRDTSDKPVFFLLKVSYSGSDNAQPDSSDSDDAQPFSDQAKGFRAFVRLALETRCRQLEQPSRLCTLEGPARSPAHNLYDTFDDAKKLSWPQSIFGNVKTFRECLCRSSRADPGGKQFSVRLNPSGGASKILVRFDGRDISDSREDISKLLGALFDREDIGKAHLIQRPIHLGVLKSDELTFTKSLIDELAEALRQLGYKPVIVDITGKTQWDNAISQLIARGGKSGYDFILGIGSQAAQALKTSYGELLGCHPNPMMIFLGVTYPVTCRLIDSLFSRFEPGEVCGVTYSADGLRSIASLIHNRLVPGCRLKYIYFKQFPQDCEAAEELRKTRLYDSGHLLVQEVDVQSLPSAVENTDTIYFSLHTVEQIFESEDSALLQLADTLKTRKVVSVTRANCEHGFAFAAVAAEAHEVGRLGAELIQKRLTKEVPHLGKHDVIIPKISYWINQAVAAKQSISFTESVLSGAAVVFDKNV